jgi:hypothetical protein
MNDELWMGIGDQLMPVASDIWHQHVAAGAQHMEASLSFMSADHHRVRNFVVRELPRVGQALPPAFIAQNLKLSNDRVRSILDELQAHMTFLFRDERGAVAWAYPVTVEPTPHVLSLSSGERIYAA